MSRNLSIAIPLATRIIDVSSAGLEQLGRMFNGYAEEGMGCGVMKI